MNNKKVNTIFLSGFSQGGTSLLLSLLDGHSELSVYPEELQWDRIIYRYDNYVSTNHMIIDWLLGLPGIIHPVDEEILVGSKKSLHWPAVDSKYSKRMGIDYIRKKLMRHISTNKLRGLENSGSFDHKKFFTTYYECITEKIKAGAIRKPIDTVKAEFDAIERFVMKKNIKYRVFKNPMTEVKEERLKLFQTYFPDGIMIFIFRNPYARFSSMINSGKLKRRGLLINPSIFLRLCRSNANSWSELMKIVKYNNVIMIGYEDLVREPGKTIKQVCKNINIPFEPILVNPTKMGHTVDVPTARVHAKNKISTESLYKWKKKLTMIEKMVFFLVMSVTLNATPSIICKRIYNDHK
ncbi:MAG: hypothetical protein AVO38_15710 [delta proteobacterium ML8_D]|nr:MAG: hypothetical protein AVO38_15710 [delta proteobacterium ML8_D]